MNSAGRINGSIPMNQGPLATEVGLFIDIRRLHDDEATVFDSMAALFELGRSDPALKENPFVKPIFEALAKAGIEPEKVDPEAVAEAVKDVKVPEAPIKKSGCVVMF
jgi:hypothetical protein